MIKNALIRKLYRYNNMLHQRTFDRQYHKKIIDHYENPRNIGSFDKTKKNIGTGLVGSPACGDVIKLQIKVDDEGKIIGARHKYLVVAVQ